MIFVGCGQCGNQVEYAILDALWVQVKDDPLAMESFFRESSGGKWFARGVCLDTEQKVIDGCVSRTRQRGSDGWTYDAKSTTFTYGGAGNNWGLGYKMCSGKFLDASLDCVRRELECSDYPNCLMVLHSLGGGTGSGQGTRMTEALADSFSDVMRTNLVVAPYHFGEVIVQHYNAILCLSKIASASHAVITFENEVVRDLCTSMRGIKKPSLADINGTIANHMLSILLPSHSVEKNIKSSLCSDIAHLCSHPGLKFLDIKHTPQTPDASIDFTYDTWTSLIRTIDKMSSLGTQSERGLSRQSCVDQSCYAFASKLIVRGKDAQEAAKAVRTLGIPDSVIVEWSSCSSPYQRSASLFSNSQSVLPILQRPLVKAKKMFEVRAFVHQYTPYGLGQDDFSLAFQSIGQYIMNYMGLSDK